MSMHKWCPTCQKWSCEPSLDWLFCELCKTYWKPGQAEPVHDWHKVNTTYRWTSRHVPFDVYVCKQCGVPGKRFGHQKEITPAVRRNDPAFGVCQRLMVAA